VAYACQDKLYAIWRAKSRALARKKLANFASHGSTGGRRLYLHGRILLVLTVLVKELRKLVGRSLRVRRLLQELH
jgi:hypothetical protein